MPLIEDLVVEALHDAREANYHDGVIDCLVMLGGTHADRGKLSTARTIATHALSRAGDRDDPRRAVAALELLARIDREEGLHADAVGRLMEAVQRSPTSPPVRLRVSLADAYAATDDFDAARDELFLARTQALRDGDPERVIDVDLLLADIERRRRHPEAAATRLSAALALAVDQGRTETEIKCRLATAREALRANDHDGAFEQVTRCEALLDGASSAEAVIDTALVYAALGHLTDAARVVGGLETDDRGEPHLAVAHQLLLEQLAHLLPGIEVHVDLRDSAHAGAARH